METGWLADLFTNAVSRGVLKAACVIGGGATAVSTDRAHQVAAAVVTLAVFAAEMLASAIAHKKALLTPPPAVRKS